VRVEDRVEPALQLEDRRHVDRHACQDEEDVVAGQDDEEVVERVFPHLPGKFKAPVNLKGSWENTHFVF